MADVNLQDLSPDEIAAIQAAQAKGPGKELLPLGPATVNPSAPDYMRPGAGAPKMVDTTAQHGVQPAADFSDVRGSDYTPPSDEKFDAKPLQEWPDEKETDVAAGITPAAKPDVLTDQAVEAAGKPPSPMARGSFARGGTPNQPGGPEGGSIDAPVKIDDDVHAALVQQGVHPAIAAMLADAKKRQDQLSEAQNTARIERNIAGERLAMDAGFGIRGANERYQGSLETANQRVTGALQQQKAGDEALGHAEKLQAFQHDLDADNPDSELSQRVAKITGVKGAPASLYPQIKDREQRKLEREKIQHEDIRAAGVQTGENLRNAETNKTHIRVAEINAAKDRGKEKQLTAQQQDQLADIRAGRAQIQRLMADLDRGDINGPTAALGALASKFGIDTESGKANAEAETAVRTVGRGIEGGRFSDADAEAYGRSVVPRANDPRELQRFKGRNILQRLDDKERELLGVAGGAGVNTGSLTPQSSSAASAPVGTRRPGPGGKTYRKVGPGQWQAE